MGPRASLDGCGKSGPPTGIRSPDRPARSESLYRLSYPGRQRDKVSENKEHQVITWNLSEVTLRVDVLCQQSCPSSPFHRKQMDSRPVGVPLTEVDSVPEYQEDTNVKGLQRLTLERK